MNSLKGKFLVTGTSSGIGRAIAEALLNAGHAVVGVARRADEVTGFEYYHPAPLDLAELEKLPQALEALMKTHADLNGAVFCAGAGRFGSLEEFSYAQIQALIDLNLTAQVFLARAVLPVLKRHGRGDLIFIGSEAALAGGKRGAIYSATKFALRGLAQALRQECAARNVRVCIVNPGMVKTRFFDELDFTHGDEPENYIIPSDVAAAVLDVLEMRGETVIDEINLSPLKKVIQPKKG
jgi:NADP-dependent 3-hydroxy acid dehydrogenase YdfG